MIDFQPVEVKDRPIIQPYLVKNSETCYRTFVDMYCWQDYYHFSWTIIEDWLVLRMRVNGERRAAYMVMSKEDHPRYSSVIPIIEEDAAAQGLPLCLMSLNEKESQDLANEYPGTFIFDNNRDFADYIYSAEDLRTLKGRKYAQKRNHVNKFKSLYSYRFEPLTRQIIPECLELAEKWEIHHDNSDTARSELAVIQKSFRYFEEFELTGGALYVDDRLIAFTYGSELNDHTFCTHVEKADIHYEGAYQMINYLFAQHIPEKYTLINREEDMGLPGLRKSKMSYNPVKLAYKTAAIKLTQEMRDIVKVWHRCFGDNDNSVQIFLSRYYFSHCSMTEKVDDQVVSMVFMIPCETELGLGAYLYGIATLPEYRHRGISTRLIRTMLERCRENGAQFSFLIPEELDLIPYYTRIGYQISNTQAIFHCDMDLGTGDKTKDRILVLPLGDQFRMEDLEETLDCFPML
jgi:hypothetical protein